MKQHIDDLLARIETLQNELEEEYRRAREDWEQKKQELADELLRHQRRYKTGLFRFLLRSRLLVILSAPVIYAGWIPLPAARSVRHALPGHLLSDLPHSQGAAEGTI